MRVAIMGSGGLGGYYGGMLARAGEDVAFIARGAHLDAMRANGLTVKTTHVGEFTIPVRATDNPAEIGPVDLVLFCVKTYDTEAAAALLRPLIGPDTVVVSLQNGVENEERIGRVIGHEHVIGAIAYISSRIEAPGVISETFVQGIRLGELNGEASPRAEALVKAFQKAEIAAEIPTDIRVAIWGKMLGISAFAAVTSVTRLPIGTVLQHPETSSLFWDLIDEGVAVGRASGAPIPDATLAGLHDIVSQMPPTMRASMYYDLEAGRRLELEDLVGSIVRLGERHGVPTPLTFAMYAALKPYADGAPDLP